MMRRFYLLGSLLLSLMLAGVVAAESDLRVVIDVSGSMKQNDPHNLRAPGLRLLSGLMPVNNQAGVWTFAAQVNSLVPWQKVTEDWRQAAHSQSDRIHSRGLYTNIEQALKKAVANVEDIKSANRSIILLSDGLVDLKAGDKSSQQSRQRILDDLLPELVQHQFKIHTIALSSEADHDLLKQLSMASNGWYRQVDTADQLERVFLHLFEQSVPRDSVPLVDNFFSIDNQVKEMTVLAFRADPSTTTSLITPDQNILTEATPDDAVRWHRENNYDLITIQNPQAGEWHIDAELDPDNRVMVVTDLQLETAELPNNILVGERFDIAATLIEKDAVIVREDFLNLVQVELMQQNAEGNRRVTPLQRLPSQTSFASELGGLFNAGRNDIVITATGPTFERQRRQSVNVVAVPLDINVTQIDSESRSHRLQVQADARLLVPASLTMTALLRGPDGDEYSYAIPLQSENQWQLTLSALASGVDYQLEVQVRGDTPAGRPVFLQPAPLIIRDDQEPVIRQSDVLSVEAPQSEAGNPVVDLDRPALSPSMILLIGNVLLAGLLIIGILLWRRSQRFTSPAESL
ncbi:von Willebrand factor type A-like protein [Methylophaga frappieri]|uniref:von Willebrand factor type A-like protein n=1 Tax=Methylophaga frappieri (strain ATCC BAA-2434 / DSM 25690 / JAM7) TaxID=754477 RepID=I1YL10_METFJ|nr:vWA domain-containing protein [Methylophaga frappieri]AFJ03603.1 von Willebrand factor type A-like protein [Methylophaga frappieri]